MTNTTNTHNIDTTSAKAEALQYVLWAIRHKEGSPFTTKMPNKPCKTKLRFFDDSSAIFDQCGCSIPLLGRMIEMLWHFDYLELGTDTAFKREHIALIHSLDYIRPDWRGFEKLGKSEEWRFWLINLSRKVEFRSLAVDDLHRIGRYPLRFAGSRFERFLTKNSESIPSQLELIQFLLHSIKQGVYPWTIPGQVVLPK
jgi:hypothetical protein